MSRQWESTDVRRGQIAEAALSVMAEEGFGKLDIASIAARVGLTPSAIYRHFQGREDVLDALLPTLHDRMRGFIASADESSEQPLEKLHTFFLTLVANIHIQKNLPEEMLTAEYLRSGSGRKAGVKSILEDMRFFVVKTVELGQRNGNFVTDVDPEGFWELLFGSVRSVVINWTLNDGNYDVDKQAAICWKTLTSLLTPSR